MLYALIFFLLTGFILIVFSVKTKDIALENKEFVSRTHTSICRGIAIILVVTMHLGAGVFGSRIFTPLGGIGVALFLICSGYGLTYSFSKNGPIGFFKKRIIKVLIPYWLSTILFIPLVLENGGGYTKLSIMPFINNII